MQEIPDKIEVLHDEWTIDAKYVVNDLDLGWSCILSKEHICWIARDRVNN